MKYTDPGYNRKLIVDMYCPVFDFLGKVIFIVGFNGGDSDGIRRQIWAHIS